MLCRELKPVLVILLVAFAQFLYCMITWVSIDCKVIKMIERFCVPWRVVVQEVEL